MKFIKTFAKLVLVLALVLFLTKPAVAVETVFTAQSLSQFNGKNGQPAYFAYKGKVYDATGQPNWKEGEHYGNLAGSDLTGMMAGAPHGEEVLVRLPVVGTYQASPSPSPVPASDTWYARPIRIAGISILGWTGILLGIAFVLNFMTCFSMPWSQLPLPWKGSRPGTDPLDVAPGHMRFTTIHRYFAWATVILGIVHGVLGFLKMLGYTL